MTKIMKNILRFFIEITFDKRWLFKIIKIYKKESYKKLNISFDSISKFDINGEKLPDYRIDDQYQNNLFKLFLDEKSTKTRTVDYGVYTIADANLEMPYGVFRICNGIIPGAMGGNECFLRAPKYIISFFKTYGNKEKIEKGLLLTLPLDENYYHWLIETLPRISILEAAGFCSDSIDLLMPSFEDRPRFVWESLDAVGWSARVIKLNKGVYKVEKLFVPTLTAPRSKISTASLDWLRNKFLSSINNVAVEKNERIYIARDDATVRHVCNATEMDDLMIKFGFKK